MELPKHDLDVKWRTEKVFLKRLKWPCLTLSVVMLSAISLSARAEERDAACFGTFSSYVTELDRLLSKERNWIRPFKELNQKHFPLHDCNIDTLLGEVQRSIFLRSKSYDINTTRYFFVFSNGEVETGFTYVVSDRKSEFDYAGFTRK